MNKTFKVVFNRARHSLMVANEITSSVQKKGTKTVIAAAAVSLMLGAGASFAQSYEYEQSSSNSGYKAAESAASVFSAGDTLVMKITGDSTQAYGLLASGKDKVYTNKGTIKVNEATESAAKTWKVKAMMADAGGKVVNEGAIEVKSAYGMTVGSSKGEGDSNTIINKGTISITGSDWGVAMEAAPTGTAGTTATAKAVATNEGTITAKNNASSVGILIAGSDGVITNSGTIDAEGAIAVKVQKEEKKTTSNNEVTFAKGSITKGFVTVGGGVEGTKVTFAKGSIAKGSVTIGVKDGEITEGTEITFEDGANFEGNVEVSTKTTKKTKLTATGLQFENLSRTNGAAIFYGDATDSSITLTNTSFSGNTATSGSGGAVYSYAASFKQTGGTYANNKAVSNAVKAESDETTVKDGATGGALMVKGNEGVVLTDVILTNNSASATKGENVGGYAYGGAICVDYSTGAATTVERAADITFAITANKAITYSGNTVSSDSTAKTWDTFGYHGNKAAAGGFLFLDRGSTAAFDIANGATLTIGLAGTTGETDSIASSIPNSGTNVNSGKHAEIEKKGAGELVINGSLNSYFGTVKVSAGTMTVNSDWTINNKVTVNGGTLATEKFSFAEDEKASLVVEGGTLQTSLAKVYSDANLETKDFKGKQNSKITLTSGTLALTDPGTYTSDFLTALKSVTDGMTLSLINAKLKLTGDQTATLIDNVIQEKVNAQVSVGESATSVTIGASSSDAAVTTGAATVTLTKAADVTVKANSAVTLVGTADGGDFVANANKLTVDGGATLNLGSVNSAVATSGALPELTLKDNAKLNVENTTVTTTALVGAKGVTINVGSSEAAGVLHTEELKLGGGLIFIDPAWSGNDEIANASSMSVGTVGTDSLNGAIVAGQNSVLALGADKATAIAGFKALAKNNPSLTWAEQGDSAVTAALYLGQPITLTEASKILVDGSKTVAPSANDVSAGVTIASKGLLMIDQASVGSSAAISGGKLALTEGSYIGLVNATGGNLTLTTDAGNTSGTATVVTDNPFVTAELSSNTIVATTNTASGLSALASTGIQAMTRRADSILAQTIADRTSVDQELGAGANLWVDVAGETYEADKLDNNASFKADMGYGAFGGEFGIGDSATAGAAIQYGKGSLRSSVSSIKNKIDSYGATLYGTMKFGESKVVADIAYVKNTNDITSSQTALNQKPDIQMYSIGVRGQHRFTAGNFQIVPSVGVRVSRLETDAMAIGSVRVDKQKQTIVQVPIALRINGMTQNAAGWSVSPSFKVAYVPTFGDKEITALGADQTVIDTSPVQADFGIRAQKGNLMLNANFMAGAGNDGASSIGGKVGLKYVF